MRRILNPLPMAYSAYIGVGGKARKIKNIYIGVNGKARRVARAYVGVGGKARQWWGIKPGLKRTIDIYSPYVTHNGYPSRYSWAETKNHVLMVIGCYEWVYYDADSGNSTRFSQYTDGAVLSIDKQTGTASKIGTYWSVGCTEIGAGSLGDGALFVGGNFKGETNNTLAAYKRYYNSSLTFIEFTSNSTVHSTDAYVLKFANNTAAIVLPYSISSHHVEPMVEVRNTSGTKTYEMIFPQSILDNYSRTQDGYFANTFRGDQKALIAFNYKRGDNTSSSDYDSIGYLMMNQNITYSVVAKGTYLRSSTAISSAQCLYRPSFSRYATTRLGDNLISLWGSDQPIYTDLSTYDPRLYNVTFTPSGTYSIHNFIMAGDSNDVGLVGAGTVNYPYSICFVQDDRYFYQEFYNKGYMVDLNGTFTEYSLLASLYEQSGGKYTTPDQGYNWQYDVRLHVPNFLSTDSGVFIHHASTKNVFQITGT